jgi:hypothetical protein
MRYRIPSLLVETHVAAELRNLDIFRVSQFVD